MPEIHHDQVDLADRARLIADEKLSNALPRRWKHVQAVAARAKAVSFVLPPTDRPMLIASAWLHDIGYSPGISNTGLHALDGARWLRANVDNERLAALVAFHSCAIFEARERGLERELVSEFSDECSLLRDALWFSDMTTGPDGQSFDIPERLAEIRSRYGPDHLVTRFWARAEPEILAAARRVEDQIATRNQPM
jgi:hypothetical protein